MQLVTKGVNDNRISEKEYRSIKERLSYSSIKLFDSDRKKFYKECVLSERRTEKQSISLILGNLVHLLLSDPNTFDEKFVIAQVNKPSGQMGDLVDNLFDRTMKSAQVENGKLIQQDSFPVIFADAFHRTKYDFDGVTEIAFKKKEQEKVLAMFEADGQLYYDELLRVVGKTVVSIATIDNAERLVNKLKSHEYTRELANVTTEGDIEVFNELPILFEVGDVPFKSMIDKIIIRHSEKTIEPIDWKCSWDAEDPERAYTKYGYYIQAAMYNKALNVWKKEHNLDDYKVLPLKFVFIDTQGWCDPVILELTADDIDRGTRGFTLRGYRYAGLEPLIEEIQWCLSEGTFTTTRELKKKNGRFRLALKYGSRN